MKFNIGVKSFLLTVIIGLSIVFSPIMKAEDASLLPNAVQQFFDSSGNPLSSGKVYFYEVGTSTFKDVYTSIAATTTYPNPITLNAAGRPPTVSGGNNGIYGIGLYRQVVKDRNGNTIWDSVTAPGGGGSTPGNVGDGNSVGTVLVWSGLVAPNQYVFAYGQEIARSTYPEFYIAVTQQANVICSAASNTLTGLSDTSQIRIGSAVELSLCVAAGTTVLGKTSSTILLSNPSTVSINSVATFFPWGNGNGSSTFNVPDLRGVALIGRTNMGGTASTNVTSTACPTISPDSLGASCGSQTFIISQNNLPSVTLTTTIASGQGSHTHGPSGGGTFLTNNGGSQLASGASQNYNTAATTAAATLPAMTGTTPLGGSGTAIANLQPSLTMNYVVKVTPDTSTSIATGVYSIGGMSGVIACGSGLLCTSNTISFNASTFAAGTTTQIQYNGGTGGFAASPNFTFISPNNVTLGSTSGATGIFDIYGVTSGRVRQTVASVAGTPTVTWGTSTGTPAVTATTPLFINSTTGNLTISPDALTRVNDTNVTLTLSAGATTALISPTSMTLGWSGQLAVSRGGSGLSSGTSGGIPYFNSTSTMASSGVLGANQLLIGGGAGASPSSISCATSTTVVHGGTPPTCGQIVSADITTNTITNSNLSQTGAATLKGNPTAATTNIVDFTLGSLTQTVSPNSTDWMLIFDNSTGTFKKINAASIASSSVAGVSSIAGNTGAFTLSTGLTNSVNDIRADIASAANFEAGTANKLLDASVVFTAETTTTYGTTTSFDFNTFINTKVTLSGGNITTMNCSNMKAGQAGTIAFIQDATGSRTAAFNTGTCSTVLKFASATFPTLTISASAVDILSYSCRSSSYCAAGLSKGYNP